MLDVTESAPATGETRAPRLLSRVLGLSPSAARFSTRGFVARRDEVRLRLEGIGEHFLAGCNAALYARDLESLTRTLEAIDLERRGFAYEGAAMGLSLGDALQPWRRPRFRAFLEGPGAAHAYMVHVGLGWTIAALPWRRLDRVLADWDPLLRWLILDGFGFYHGYFHAPRAIRRWQVPRRVTSYARRAFDFGLGRSIWFVDGADIATIAATVRAFPASRQPDLWSGVGLACAYAGGATDADVRALAAAAGPALPDVAQGICFAAECRQRAGNPAAHTEHASNTICGMSARAASAMTIQALDLIDRRDAAHGFERWRAAIRAHFAVEQA